MEQLLDVLGEKRLKKMARKNRRSRNQKIREGKVVLNERGEWVDREWGIDTNTNKKREELLGVHRLRLLRGGGRVHVGT